VIVPKIKGIDVSAEEEQTTHLEKQLARKLFHYFTGARQQLKFEDQPFDVQELWLGAARVAVETLQDASD
jgi:hypothetical protein